MDRRTDGPTDRRTDIRSYRDARTHQKRSVDQEANRQIYDVTQLVTSSLPASNQVHVTMPLRHVVPPLSQKQCLIWFHLQR